MRACVLSWPHAHPPIVTHAHHGIIDSISALALPCCRSVAREARGSSHNRESTPAARYIANEMHVYGGGGGGPVELNPVYQVPMEAMATVAAGADGTSGNDEDGSDGTDYIQVEATGGLLVVGQVIGTAQPTLQHRSAREQFLPSGSICVWRLPRRPEALSMPLLCSSSSDLHCLRLLPFCSLLLPRCHSERIAMASHVAMRFGCAFASLQ